VGVSRNELHRNTTKASLPKISEEDMAVYRATAQQRQEEDERDLLVKRERAWETARRAAKLLKEDFGAQRVVVFGSLLRSECFNKWSDVDIAAWGIRPEDTFRAMGAVMDLAEDIEINLVDMDACRPTLWTVIEREGQEI